MVEQPLLLACLEAEATVEVPQPWDIHQSQGQVAMAMDTDMAGNLWETAQRQGESLALALLGCWEMGEELWFLAGSGSCYGQPCGASTSPRPLCTEDLGDLRLFFCE